MHVCRILALFIQTFFGWRMRKAPVYAVAIAYSTLFSLASLLILSSNLAAPILSAATYVQSAAICSIDGAAGSALALFIYAYQIPVFIFLYDARFVYNVAQRYGYSIVPDSGAISIRIIASDEPALVL